MLQEIGVVAGSVLTLFLLMAVGFFLAKKRLLTEGTLKELSTVLLYVVCPVIMINTFLAREPDAATLRELLISGAILLGTFVLNMLFIGPWFRKQGEDRGVMRFAAIYGNTGFMGIPLIQAVLGESGMLPTVVCLAVFNLTAWTHGMWLIGGRAQISVRKAVLNPGVIGFALAIVLFLLRVRLPGPVASAFGFIGDLNTPLAMLVIGGQMAAVDFRSLFGDWRVYAASAIKLLVIPAIAMLVMLPFGVDRTTFMAVAILSGCPVAGVTSLFCQKNGKDTSLAARLVTVSTILCIVTLPLIAMDSRLLCGA